MTLRSTLAILPLAAAALLSSCGAVLSPEPPEIGLETGRLRPCPPSPNCVCSQDSSEDHAIEPLEFGGDPEVAFESLVAFLVREDGAEILAREQGYAHAVYTTSLMRYRDDLELLLTADEGVVHVRSASRLS